MEYINDIKVELYNQGFIGSKQALIFLIDRCQAGRIGHALGKPGNDGCHGISRHQARQDEIQYEGEYKSDQEPEQLVKEILSISFQRSTSSLI
jgi:hypothetical protein